MENFTTSFSKDLFKLLRKNKKKLIEIYSKEVNYSTADVEFLWKDMDNFLRSFNKFYNWQKKLWDKENNLQCKWSSNTFSRHIPWGRCLAVLPSNALIPLLPMIVISFVSTGNHIEIIVPRKVKKTYNVLSNILKKVFNHSLIMEKPTGVELALKKILSDNPPNFLYYIGNSKYKSKIYNMCFESNVDLIYEGGGKSVCICDYKSIPEINKFSKTLIEAKMVCNGELCTSPNTVFVQRKILNKVILSISNIKVFKDTNLTKNIPFLKGHVINSYKSTSLKQKYYLHHVSCKIVPIAINHDMFSNATFLCTYNTDEELIDTIKQYNGGIQVSIFSKDIQKWKNLLLQSTCVARLVFNISPIFQNSILPWGGYKYSGYSPLENFLEKSTRKIILENYV